MGRTARLASHRPRRGILPPLRGQFSHNDRLLHRPSHQGQISHCDKAVYECKNGPHVVCCIQCAGCWHVRSDPAPVVAGTVYRNAGGAIPRGLIGHPAARLLPARSSAPAPLSRPTPRGETDRSSRHVRVPAATNRAPTAVPRPRATRANPRPSPAGSASGSPARDGRARRRSGRWRRTRR